MCQPCGCDTAAADTAGAEAPGAAEGVRVYTVEGMTCGHCVNSVSAEVGRVPGVTGVQVDLEAGRVSVSGSGFDDAAIGGAVRDAGYALAAG
ncbi:heavy-metal-associated domain-containing protein [Nocardiopsis potens]|uniref:heavy-metal-associated domain-containing protein n=1 Tax=Nocardiopsis potens TaxID=1246458 RepID=UPI0003459C98|nr:heavy-metal-associated domain-containing protein [Nocardiopsis potens]